MVCERRWFGQLLSLATDTHFDNTLDVAMTFGVIQRTQLGGSLALLGVGHEHGPGTLTLCTNDSTHLEYAIGLRCTVFGK